jgi:hypothetical protein
MPGMPTASLFFCKPANDSQDGRTAEKGGYCGYSGSKIETLVNNNIGKAFLGSVLPHYVGVSSFLQIRWISEQLSGYVFYDCPESAIVISDFPKGPRAVAATKAAAAFAGKEVRGDKNRPSNDNKFPEASEVLIENLKGE